ncbi:hypothetical protein [Oceanobacillus locisalsi]|uniref:Uncharacterized protein n=1 Tax=Oceanobacillus locisalsi TaxID=546107 RepID=A0ABW3NKF2_9BACI
MMAIEIKSTKGISENPFVVDIVKAVQANNSLFLYLSRIFSTYKKNSLALREETFSYIDRLLNSPKLNTSSDSSTIDKVKQTMKAIYTLNSQQFSNVRSNILENTVYHFGPVTTNLLRRCVFIEPIIKENDIIIGDSDIKCDFVFVYNESTPMEFIECKSDIANVIPRNLPLEKLQKPHKNKLTYLNKAYNHLKKYDVEPKIYFACYNLDYGKELVNLRNNWGYDNMMFVNAEEIIYGKSE